MKILQIHTGLSLMGGCESMIIGLSNEQIKEYDVTVCSVFKPVEGGVYYTRFSENVKREHLGIVKNGFSIKNCFKIFNYLRKSGADIVHIHGFFYYYALAIILLHRKIKFVYTIHSDAYMENSKWDRKILWLKKICFKHRWMNPVTISPESKLSFSTLYKIDSRLIQNGIPIPQVSLEPNEIDFSKISPYTKVFLHPGRISKPKNQLVLCKVFQRLIEDGEDVILLIAGTKQSEEIFEQIEPYFCKRIKYLGERDDVPQLLSRADGFCLPSIWEGLPVTLLEALSVGCIPICSPVGGIVGVINTSVNGMLSKSSSEEDYYDCMKTFLLYNNDKIQSMKQEAIKTFIPYDIKNTSKSYIDFYKELLD